MASITSSLFGTLAGMGSPETLLEQRVQQAYGGNRRPGDVFFNASAGAGEQLMQSTRKLFGQEDEQTRQQRKLQAIIQGVQAQTDVSTPEGLTTLADQLNMFPEFSGIALAMRQEAAKLKMDVTKNEIGNALKQAQIQTEGFQQTKLAADAEKALREPTTKEATQYKVLTKEEATALGLPTDKGQTYQQNIKTNQVSAVGGGGIAVNIPSPEKDLTKSMELRNNFRGETKDIDTGLNALYNVKQLLGERSGLADAIAKRQFAKFSGDRDISNKDIAAFGNFGSLGQRLEGIFNQFLAGTYSPAQVEEASRIADNLLKSLQSKRSQLETQYTSEAKARGVDDSRINFIVPKFAAPTTKERIPVPANVVAQKGWKQGQKVKRGNKSYTFDGTQLIED